MLKQQRLVPRTVDVWKSVCEIQSECKIRSSVTVLRWTRDMSQRCHQQLVYYVVVDQVLE